MARGGKRTGAGRKNGSLTKRTREIAESAAAEGITPLEWMLKVLRDPMADYDRRDKAARDAAPYVHPRLAAIEHSGPDGGALVIEVVRFAAHPDSE